MQRASRPLGRKPDRGQSVALTAPQFASRYLPPIGVNVQTITFLLAAQGLGARYDRTLTIGRQSLFASAPGIVDAYQHAGQEISLAAAEQLRTQEGDPYIEPLLRRLGATHVDSLDASGYEQATIIHDLNQPLPDELRRRYTLVIDGGSLEHVFNFPVALRSCMEAVEPGGHLLLVTPANNQLGHGFYQFSPDLFYRALTPANGFDMVEMLIIQSHRWARWRRVADPADVGGRVTLTSPWHSLLYVLARRTSTVEAFLLAPQQSDYTVAWSDPSRPVTRRARWYERLPGPLRRGAKLGAALVGTSSGRDHFEPVDMARLATGRR